MKVFLKWNGLALVVALGSILSSAALASCPPGSTLEDEANPPFCRTNRLICAGDTVLIDHYGCLPKGGCSQVLAPTGLLIENVGTRFEQQMCINSLGEMTPAPSK